MIDSRLMIPRQDLDQKIMIKRCKSIEISDGVKIEPDFRFPHQRPSPPSPPLQSFTPSLYSMPSLIRTSTQGLHSKSPLQLFTPTLHSKPPLQVSTQCLHLPVLPLQASTPSLHSMPPLARTSTPSLHSKPPPASSLASTTLRLDKGRDYQSEVI